MCHKTPVIKMKGTVFNAWTTAISYNQLYWRLYLNKSAVFKKKKKYIYIYIVTSLKFLTYQTWSRVIRNHELNKSKRLFVLLAFFVLSLLIVILVMVKMESGMKKFGLISLCTDKCMFKFLNRENEIWSY